MKRTLINGRQVLRSAYTMPTLILHSNQYNAFIFNLLSVSIIGSSAHVFLGFIGPYKPSESEHH